MARTAQEVELSLKGSIAQVDPTIDTEAGPIPDVFIIPEAQEISTVEVKVDDLGRRYSVDYVSTLGTNEVTLFGANHGLRKNQGETASGSIVFFTTTRPAAGQVITIPAGTLVASTDGTLIYATTEEATITGDNAGIFFVASRRRYEVSAPIRALGVGSEFSVPSGRINIPLQPIQGIQGVDQLNRIVGGDAPQTNVDFMELVRSRLSGSALGSLAGLDSLVREFGRGNLSDVSIVFSTDIINFRRRPRRPAADVWLVGSIETEQTDTFTSSGPATTDFVLLQQPATAVLTASANNVNVPFVFVPDTDETVSGSRNSQNLVRLLTPVSDGSVVAVKYLYNSLIGTMQDFVDGRTTATQANSVPYRRQPRLYELDILVRAAIRVTIRVEATIVVLSSFDEAAAQSAAINAVIATVNTNRFASQLLPEDTRLAIASATVGVSAVTMQKFQRATNPLIPVDALEFAPTEYPVITTDLITINVRRA